MYLNGRGKFVRMQPYIRRGESLTKPKTEALSLSQVNFFQSSQILTVIGMHQCPQKLPPGWTRWEFLCLPCTLSQIATNMYTELERIYPLRAQLTDKGLIYSSQ